MISAANSVRLVRHVTSHSDADARAVESDVLHFTLLGKHIVVLNSKEAVHELLDVRSGKYSDRYG